MEMFVNVHVLKETELFLIGLLLPFNEAALDLYALVSDGSSGSAGFLMNPS